MKLAGALADAGYIVTVHDPLAQDAALAVLGDKVRRRLVAGSRRCATPTC